jgi:hypothetical protein
MNMKQGLVLVAAFVALSNSGFTLGDAAVGIGPDGTPPGQGGTPPGLAKKQSLVRVASIPEPAVITLLSVGIAGLAYRQRKMKG